MGQVHSKTELGAWITFVSSLRDVQTIVDIGTWSGAGTTLRAAKGVQKKRPEARRDSRVVGFEIDRGMAARARRRLKGFDFVNVVYGSIVKPEDLDKNSLSTEEHEWLKTDLEKMALAPYVLGHVPDRIDLLILDGGEFSSQAEYFALRDRVFGWIILDDINTRKNSRVFKALDSDDFFSLVWITEERNGAAVFRRLPSTSNLD
jgi:hypothetical protein